MMVHKLLGSDLLVKETQRHKNKNGKTWDTHRRCEIRMKMKISISNKNSNNNKTMVQKKLKRKKERKTIISSLLSYPMFVMLWTGFFFSFPFQHWANTWNKKWNQIYVYFFLLLSVFSFLETFAKHCLCSWIELEINDVSAFFGN